MAATRMFRVAAMPGLQCAPAFVAGAAALLHVLPYRVPSAIGRDAYRIVQEGLTNARKHAPDGAVAVSVRTTDTAVHVSIDNRLSGDDLALPGGERGLIGLRERVQLAGGTLRIDHSADRFTLVADLPYEALR